MPKISDKPVKKITITLLQETYEKLKTLAEIVETPIATLGRTCVEKFVENYTELINK